MRPTPLALAIAFALTAGCAHQLPETLDQTVVADDLLPDQTAPLEAQNHDPLEQVVVLPDAPILTPPEPEPDLSLWPRLRAGMSMVGQYQHPRLDKQRKWYASHQSYFDRVFQRGERYLHFIASAVEARGMPMELALLPVVESAFDPFAYSHSHAAGLWQFVASTGEQYGLKRNWWYEGRRDVVASTNAALDYLSYLHKKFGNDWLLALAAYNSGEGTVGRAIRRNKRAGKPTDYWSLKLPRETSAYVPQLLAVAEIVHDPDQFNITLAELPNSPYFASVSIAAQIDLAQAAKMAGIEINELYLLNPAYNRWTTAPGDKHELLLPIHCIDAFEKTLASTPKEQWIASREYIVKSGDSLGRIARQNKVEVADLRRENRLKGDLIRVGQVIKIPGAGGGTAPLSADRASYYAVQSGDSLWEIARAHNARVRDLRAWNNLAPNDVIRPGQQLQVSSAKPMNSTRKVNYKVRRGDSLARIANKFNVQVKDIVSWNNINPSKYLQPGQKLKLMIDVRRI